MQCHAQTLIKLFLLSTIVFFSVFLVLFCIYEFFGCSASESSGCGKGGVLQSGGAENKISQDDASLTVHNSNGSRQDRRINQRELSNDKIRGSSERPNKPLPREFIEPKETEQIPTHIKPEIFFVLKALEGLELPRTWQLDPKDIETFSIESSQSILSPGDSNDVVIVVIAGELGIFTNLTTTDKSHQINMKCLKCGDSYFSQTSIIEILMGVQSENKYVHLKALSNCRVAKYKLTSFYSAYLNNPQQWIRTIQVVMTRLQQCTLITCNMYLGIGEKCIDSKRQKPDPKKFDSFESLSQDQQLSMGVQWMAEAMGIPEHASYLKEKVKKHECSKGTIVTEENTFEIDMIFVVHGRLQLRRGSMQREETGTLTFDVNPGDILPSMQILTNEPAMCTATAVEKTIYFRISREEYIQCLFTYPIIYLRLAFHALQFVSPFARVFDLAVSWIRIETGQALFRLGDPSTCMFIVMGGRLRSVESSKIIEEYGRLDVIGITEMAERKSRKSTVLAVRFSHLVAIPEKLLGFVKTRYPQTGAKLLQLISKCWKAPTPETMTHFETTKIQNLRTLAIVPAAVHVPLTAFTCELYNHLSAHVNVLRLSSSVVGKYFEPDVIKKKADYGLMHWLNVQEISYSLVLYQCDTVKSNWTRRCLRMADAILVVAMGDRKKNEQTLAETLLLCNEKGVRQSKELVILWPENTSTPSGTSDWMCDSYYSGYHHLRVASRVFEMNSQVKENNIVRFYENSVFTENGTHPDFSRLARILTGNAIGVVFGGGGARGAAHAGALRALLDKKIPIDMVGGTSIGALFGSLYATTPDLRAVSRLKCFFMDRMKNNILDVLRDLTWAYCAILTGYRFNMCVRKMIGDMNIEDCWISFFCISTDITSSMSIAGYVPPICDPQDGHLLLDGAYVNNLPADVMRSLGANVVIAIDVGMSDESHNLTNYGYSISGLWVLFKRWWPFGEPIRILSMSEIQNRLAYVCCVNQLETVKQAQYCFYVKLPIESFAIFDFSLFDQAAQIGYDVTMVKLEECFENSKSTRQKLLGCARNSGHATHNSKNDNIISFVNMPILP